MADLAVLLGVLAFFAVCVLLVIGLDRLVGPDDTVGADADVGGDAMVGRGDAGDLAEAAR